MRMSSPFDMRVWWTTVQTFRWQCTAEVTTEPKLRFQRWLHKLWSVRYPLVSMIKELKLGLEVLPRFHVQVHKFRENRSRYEFVDRCTSFDLVQEHA